MDKETPWGNESFIIFDTSSLGPESSRVQTSWRNIIHALVIKSMSDSLIADGWEFPSTAKKSFAVLSPFNKQTTFIRSLVMPSWVKGVEGGISTVHRFQGNERDVMIFTPAIDEDQTRSKTHMEDAKRFNVATSRSRHFT